MTRGDFREAGGDLPVFGKVRVNLPNIGKVPEAHCFRRLSAGEGV